MKNSETIKTSKRDDDREKSDADEQPQSKKEQQASGDARDQARRAENRENQQRGNMAQHGWQLGSLAPGQTAEVTYALRPYEGAQFGDGTGYVFAGTNGTAAKKTQGKLQFPWGT